MDQIVIEILKQLDANLLDAFEERAGVMEFDANLARPHAECLALLDVLRRNPGVLSGVTVLQVGGRGSTRWALATDAGLARKRLATMGLIEIGTADLASVIKQQFGGAALLAPVR